MLCQSINALNNTSSSYPQRQFRDMRELRQADQAKAWKSKAAVLFDSSRKAGARAERWICQFANIGSPPYQRGHDQSKITQ